MAITLKAARVNKGLNQKEAAAALGVSVATLCSWETGRTFPSVKSLQTIEALYGVPYGEILFLPQ